MKSRQQKCFSQVLCVFLSWSEWGTGLRLCLSCWEWCSCAHWRFGGLQTAKPTVSAECRSTPKLEWIPWIHSLMQKEILTNSAFQSFRNGFFFLTSLNSAGL